ncbi:uncharacterized protein Tco025E_07579 [Trypanosoma conorhini]|uniref:Uncharacterized protein n=1 Tax=Trypanosoma conorhini TaxID=83891 RepID=A0A422NLQ8_9TRYP|nr:uncharacterized protein Tco025E_07579 [Trypanosoma conorhini]RNF06395.1 hypothetical protein Tco025E_07579 [Trypanosoma conorhini]
MASDNVEEFDLMRYLHLSSLKDEKQLTEGERQALAEQRRQATNETQYAAHCLREKVDRMREQYSLRGCAPKPKTYPRDADSKYGLFWFGRGKYEGDCDAEDECVDDNAATSLPKQPQQGEGENAGELSHDDSEAEDTPDEERFKVWRPIEGPPLRRDKASSVSLVAASSRRQHHGRVPRPTPKPLPALRAENSALTPPWAEDCDVNSVPKEGQTSRVKRQHELYKSGMLPRGKGGIDDVLRHARASQALVLDLQKWRMREDERRSQHALRRALDEQIIDKRKRQLAQLEEELVHIYGPTMRHILHDAFGQAPSIQRQQQIHGVPADSENKNDDDLFLTLHQKELPQRSFRVRAVTEESRLREARLAWLSAWEEHKRSLGAADLTPTASGCGDDALSFATTPPLSPSFRLPNQPSSDKMFAAERQRHEPLHHRHRYLSAKKKEEATAGLNKSTSFSF